MSCSSGHSDYHCVLGIEESGDWNLVHVDQIKLEKANSSDYEIFEGKLRHCVLPRIYLML